MASFVTGITDIISGVFGALIKALGSVGDLIFTTGEGGAITGPSGFGWILILGIGLPFAWRVFSLLINWIKGLGKGSGR